MIKLMNSGGDTLVVKKNRSIWVKHKYKLKDTYKLNHKYKRRPQG